MASRSRTRRIGFLGYSGMTALDLVGPAEVFSTAAELAAPATRSARPLYGIVVLGLDHQPFLAESGLRFLGDTTLADAPPLDTLIVPGGRGLRDPAVLANVATWLRRRQRGIRRVASVCTGAWALAEAGLLDGLRATTHWRFADTLAAAYPDVRVEPDTIYIREDRIYTSAGITAGIDLALALVEEDHGPSLALAVARELVVHLKRAGGQRQFSERLAMSVDSGSPLAELTAWIQAHLADDLSLARLADRCHVSPRQLARRFDRAFGMSPASYVERLRTDEASQLLLSAGSIERIAAAVGFSSADVFRRAFERRFGVSPQQYRDRFGS
jgi:transcriptional regulator GlxA family with amidase domain